MQDVKIQWDVYSFGMIMWEMITREIPYYGMTSIQIIGMVSDFRKIVEVPNTGNPGFNN